ncbi:unnamed protein product, partial [Mesorhabditis spiculigera]
MDIGESSSKESQELATNLSATSTSAQLGLTELQKALTSGTVSETINIPATVESSDATPVTLVPVIEPPPAETYQYMFWNVNTAPFEKKTLPIAQKIVKLMMKFVVDYCFILEAHLLYERPSEPDHQHLCFFEEKIQKLWTDANGPRLQVRHVNSDQGPTTYHYDGRDKPKKVKMLLIYQKGLPEPMLKYDVFPMMHTKEQDRGDRVLTVEIGSTTFLFMHRQTNSMTCTTLEEKSPRRAIKPEFVEWFKDPDEGPNDSQNLIIFGDLNLPGMDWHKLKAKPCISNPNITNDCGTFFHENGFSAEWVREVTRFQKEDLKWEFNRYVKYSRAYTRLDAILTKNGGVRLAGKAKVEWVKRSDAPEDYLSDHAAILFNLIEKEEQKLNIEVTPKYAIFLNGPFDPEEIVTKKIDSHGDPVIFSEECILHKVPRAIFVNLKIINQGDSFEFSLKCSSPKVTVDSGAQTLEVESGKTINLQLKFTVPNPEDVKGINHLEPDGAQWLILTHKTSKEQYHWQILFNDETEVSLAF